jgi:metal transporter CNNM
LLQLLVNPHWLLCALLVINAGAYESLPIFLDRLLNPVAAILISVSAILIFGEILPQAVCRKFGMQIGAYSSWMVRIVMIITAPISWPLGKCLDWLLGYESALFRSAGKISVKKKYRVLFFIDS